VGITYTSDELEQATDEIGAGLGSKDAPTFFLTITIIRQINQYQHKVLLYVGEYFKLVST
jgi:hypothetical protein